MILKMLEEKYARNQILLQPDFSSSNMISLFFLLFSRSIKSIQHFIEYDIFVMLDEMLDWFNKAFRKFLNIHRKKNVRRSLSLNRVTSHHPDTLLKETSAKLFSWVFRDLSKNTF